MKKSIDKLADDSVGIIWNIFLIVAGICSMALAIRFTFYLFGRMSIL